MGTQLVTHHHFSATLGWCFCFGNIFSGLLHRTLSFGLPRIPAASSSYRSMDSSSSRALPMAKSPLQREDNSRLGSLWPWLKLQRVQYKGRGGGPWRGQGSTTAPGGGGAAPDRSWGEHWGCQSGGQSCGCCSSNGMMTYCRCLKVSIMRDLQTSWSEAAQWILLMMMGSRLW